MSGLSEREAFEAWAHQHGFSLAAVVEGDDYLNDATADAWDAWQARAALPVQQGWQPIETAPIDAQVLLCSARDGYVIAGCYDADRREWWETNTHWTDAHGDCLYPTHWQPLPAPEAAPLPTKEAK
jgi:hypothetical protein